MSENNTNQNSTQHKRISIVDKYGNYLVVTARMSHLFSFLLRQLNYLSTRTEDNFGSIVAWAKDLIGPIESSRQDIWNLLEDIAYDHPKCGWSSILDCRIRYNLEGKSYCHCGWFDSKNDVSKEVVEKNPTTLGEARCCHLLDEIYTRINKAVKNFLGRNKATCHYDLEVQNFIENQLEFYDQARVEAFNQVKKLEALREEQRAERQSERSNNSANRQSRSNGKQRSDTQSNRSQQASATKKPEAESVAEQVELPRVINLPASKPVTKAFSYASMVSGNTGTVVSKPVVSINNNNDSNNIINVDDNCPPVEDLNVEVSVTETQVTETPVSIPLTKAQKKAAKKAAQRKRKAAAKATEVIDMTDELPTDALELCPESNPSPKSIPSPKVEPETKPQSTPEPIQSELIEVEMMRLINGKPIYSKVIMTRAEYALINKISSVSA